MALSIGVLMSSKHYAALKSRVISNKRYRSGRVCKVGPPVSPVDNYVADKVALITGGAAGIGLTIAREFLKNSVKGVTIADVDTEQGGLTLLNLQKEFGPKRVIFTQTDVTNMVEFEDSFKCTIEAFQNFDILVNNAGFLNDQKWERTIQINLNGVINGCLLAMETYIPKYRSAKFGVVMNVASIAGLQAIPAIPVYVSTKHALIGLGKCLSEHYHYQATKAKIITICPGYYDTAMTGNYFKGKTLHKRSEKVVQEAMSSPKFPMQKVDFLGKAIMPIMNRSKNGACWVIDVNNISEVYLPAIKELKKLQKVKLDDEEEEE